jgi:autophagy-related protein 101
MTAPIPLKAPHAKATSRRAETFALPPLRCETSQIRDVVSALAHTIVFTRALGCATPREEACARLDARFVACGSAEADKKVKDGIDALVAWALRGKGSGGARGGVEEAEVCVRFYEPNDGTHGGSAGSGARPRTLSGALGAAMSSVSGGGDSFGSSSSGGGMYGGHAGGFWEQWRIGLEIFRGEELDEEERGRAAEALRDQLVGTQQHILGLVNEMKAHLPPVTTSDVVSFPFEIIVPTVVADSPGSFGRDMLKRLASLSSTPPNML